MSNYSTCCRPGLLFLVLPFFLITVSVYAEQPEDENYRNRLLVTIEVLDARKGILSSFTMLATALLSAWYDLKTSINDEKAFFESIFWPQEELEEYEY